MALALAAAGAVQAGSGIPASVVVTSGGGLSVQASGTWSWPEMATASKLSYTGFAIDWGDVSSGNTVGSYHIGDGTAATNVVMQPTSPAQGSGGTWGPVSHIYATAGTYKVCVILYDLGDVKPFKTSGYHGLQAGGTGRNTDNSVDTASDPAVKCATVTLSQVAGATATPFQSFEGATLVAATGTPPSTSTVPATPPTGNNSALPLLLLGLSAGFGVVALKPVRQARRR